MPRSWSGVASIKSVQHRQAKQRIRELEALCAAVYQMAGCYNAPVEFLDNLSAAATGKPLPHDPGAGLPMTNQWRIIIDELEEKLDKQSSIVNNDE